MGRLKNIILAKLFTRFPSVFNPDRYAEKAEPVTIEGIPWARPRRPLKDSVIAIVTTAGVHLRGQEPFDMKDKNGDPTFRPIPSDTPAEKYTITHDYYDHRDADRDINIVFPIDRLMEMKAEGLIGGIARTNYGFMGHILGPHIDTLVKRTAPEVAERLRREGVDVVLLTPG